MSEMEKLKMKAGNLDFEIEQLQEAILQLSANEPATSSLLAALISAMDNRADCRFRMLIEEKLT